MTEQAWLECATWSRGMVDAIGDRASARKLRLFAAGCVRSILSHVYNIHRTEVIRVLEIAERFADGLASTSEVEVARRDTIPWDTPLTAVIEACNPDARLAALRASRAAADAVRHHWLLAHREHTRRSPEAVAARRSELHQQTALAREIFGNPFRPVSMDAAWRTATVVSLATAIYDDRAFDRLPILADALEDAGCTSADLLDHCRQAGDHVRGCWALDLVLGKQ